MSDFPGSTARHEGDYNPQAWKAYTAEELRWWVKLLRKRAEHRSDLRKKEKDLYDAGNYQSMLEQQYPGEEVP